MPLGGMGPFVYNPMGGAVASRGTAGPGLCLARLTSVRRYLIFLM